ncbi:hypothetical protein ACFWPV_27550 [Streptomyces uncialis]|uniref:hypothetical protein n=1 Tax=Streptomyces uncialis TaxID=1048205 RepID=UPI003669E367
MPDDPPAHHTVPSSPDSGRLPDEHTENADSAAVDGNIHVGYWDSAADDRSLDQATDRLTDLVAGRHRLRSQAAHVAVQRHRRPARAPAFPARKEARHRCLRHFGEQLGDVTCLEPVHVGAQIDMGAWYGYKPLYRPEALGGVPRSVLIEALRAEGMEVGAPSGPRLSTLPLYARPENPLFPGTPKKGGAAESGSHAEHVERHALSLPAFTNWPGDRTLIDRYAGVFRKIGRHREALVRYAAGPSR